MLKLLQKMRRREWGMAAVCVLFILGQIYFDLSLPDYMSDLTVLIKIGNLGIGAADINAVIVFHDDHPICILS